MAKKQTTETESERQSRKEILRQRKQEEQLRSIRIATVVGGILIGAVLLFAIVNEFFLTPRQPVATVSGEAIALSDWQDRVRFERAQRITTLENQLELFNNDVGLIQQFAGQSIVELQNAEALGEAALNAMVRDTIVRQAAEERGLTPTEADIDARIAEAFNFFDGGLPTPAPTAVPTTQPTPSLTPIPDPNNPVVEPVPEVVGPEPEAPAVPTATPVSRESFEQEFGDLIGQYRDLGVDESVYRTAVAGAIMSERVAEALQIEQELPQQAEKASAFLVTYATEEEAQQALDEIAANGFLPVWNSVRSLPQDTLDASSPTATELLWRTQTDIAEGFGEEVANAIFDLPVETPSQVIEVPLGDGDSRWVITMTSGREPRDLSPSELQQQRQDALTAYVDNIFNSESIELGTNWRGRVPTVPVLDPKFLVPPTATPLVLPTATPVQ